MAETEKSHLRSFLEPTFCLAVITSILYFWGYIFFAVFCERLGIGFNGIEVPFTSYLLVGWEHILWITMGLCLLLCCYEFVTWVLLKAAEFILTRLFKRFYGFFEKFFNSALVKWIGEIDEPKNDLFKIGATLFIAIAIAFYGSINLIEKAKAFADHKLEAKEAIVIYDTEHKILNGNFIYLMDYGSALIVGELSDKDEVTRIRILKAGSYAAYSFNKEAPPPQGTQL